MRLQTSILSAAAALLAVLPPAAARAASCVVPAALTCKGCAAQISVSVQQDGTCRISFTPGPALSAAPGTEPLGLDIRVEVGGPSRPGAGALAHRLHAARRLHRVAYAREAPGPRCFVFNDRRYCE